MRSEAEDIELNCPLWKGLPAVLDMSRNLPEV